MAESESDALLTAHDIHTYYGDSYVLHGLNLRLEAGKIVVILGRNGMGKTTLIRSIAGLTPPRRGDVRFEGKSLKGLPPYAISQKGIAIVPQGRRIFKSLSVRENLTLPTSSLAGRRAHVSTRKRWDLDAVLKAFPQLADRIDHGGGALSGGEQQMLAIGRALMANPSVILMDEPSEGLSPKLVQHVEAILRSLRDEGLSILMVEQNLGFALSIADYIYVISSGRLVFDGTPSELTDRKGIMNSHLGLAETKVH